MNRETIPLSSDQMTILGMVGAVVLLSVLAPMMFAPSPTPADSAPNNGTTYDAQPSTPSQSSSQPAESLGSGAIERLSYSNADLHPVPDSHVGSTNPGRTPDVSSSTGAQTLRVEATTVNGTAALNLTDDQRHDGRWVSVSTDWLVEQHGTVPDVATIAHEDGHVYTEQVRTRSGQAVFWVRGFSTNLVTFGGELEIVGQPATTEIGRASCRERVYTKG